MSAEADLYSALTSDTGVSALVEERVYPEVAPQDQPLPSIAFSRLATEYVNSIHGTSLAQKATLDVYCMGTDKPSAEELCDEVELALRTADFITVGRRAEFDGEQLLWSAVLTVDYWE